MTDELVEPLRLRIHISEPFTFERENVGDDLFGTTMDHADPEAEEWLIELDGWFTFNELEYDMVVVAPRYIGERLDRVHNALVGVPVRVAHRIRDGWHFAMTGVMSIRHDDPADEHPDAPLSDIDLDDDDDAENSEDGDATSTSGHRPTKDGYEDLI